jgi:hypothetical protein
MPASTELPQQSVVWCLDNGPQRIDAKWWPCTAGHPTWWAALAGVSIRYASHPLTRQLGLCGNDKQAEQPLLTLMAAGSNASPGRRVLRANGCRSRSATRRLCRPAGRSLGSRDRSHLDAGPVLGWVARTRAPGAWAATGVDDDGRADRSDDATAADEVGAVVEGAVSPVLAGRALARAGEPERAATELQAAATAS